MFRRALAVAALFCLVSGGCNDRNARPVNVAAPAGSDVAAAPDSVVHVEDDGKAFDVGMGATVTFKLASNSGTGYVWVPTQVDARVLVQQGDRTTETSSDTPGAPKLDVYRFAASAAGSSTVEMSLKRPFGSSPPAKTIRVTVNVH